MAKKQGKKHSKMVVFQIPNLPVSMSDHAFQQPVDPRRRPEMYDSRLIQEDRRAMSNLPTEPINKQFNPGKFMPHYWMESEIE